MDSIESWLLHDAMRQDSVRACKMLTSALVLQSAKKTYTREQWESKLSDASIQKEDLNKLVMNFLVTEVRHALCLVSCQPALATHPPSSCTWQRLITLPLTRRAM